MWAGAHLCSFAIEERVCSPRVRDARSELLREEVVGDVDSWTPDPKHPENTYNTTNIGLTPPPPRLARHHLAIFLTVEGVA